MVDGKLIFGMTLFAGFGAVSIYGGIRSLKTAQQLKNIPTSKVRSAAMGLVELKGKAKANAELLTSPIQKKKCVFYNYKIEQLHRDMGSSVWRTIGAGNSFNSFFLEDDTGKILVEQKYMIKQFDFDIGSESGKLPDDIVNMLINNPLDKAKVKEEFVNQAKQVMPEGFVKMLENSSKGSSYKMGKAVNKFRGYETIVEEGDEIYALGNTVRENDGSMKITGLNTKFGYIGEGKEAAVFKTLLKKAMFWIALGLTFIIIALIVILVASGVTI